MTTNEITQTWEDLIQLRLRNDNFRSRTCQIYSQDHPVEKKDENKSCSCGRLIRSHSFYGLSIKAKFTNANMLDWEPEKEYRSDFYISVPVTVYGRLKPYDCKFIQLDIQSDMKIVYDLLVDDCEGKPQRPALILSVYGGAKYFIMTEKLEKEIIRGIIDAATTADAWILTTGVSNGVSKLVGEGISHYRLLREYPNKVKCIGLTMWGTINENTRLELKRQTESYSNKLIERQTPENVQDEKETIERNHTHCILLYDGTLNGYLDDTQRDQLVTRACKADKDHTCDAVTIIIEGGVGTLEVIQHDIAADRPIVLIQGSGRLADVIALLIEQTSHSKQNHQSYVPSDEDVQEAFQKFFPNIEQLDIPSSIKAIQDILKRENRHLLNVFSLERDDDVAKTIFKAIFAMKNKREELVSPDGRESEEHNSDEKRRKDDFRLIHLALKWNYIDGVLSILQSRQDAMRKKGPEYIEKEMRYYKKLFKNSLEKNRSTFVEYMLAAGFDPCILLGIQDKTQRETKLLKLYSNTHAEMEQSHRKCVGELFGNSSMRSIYRLDRKLNKFVGSFVGTIYKPKEDDLRKRFCIDMRNHLCNCRVCQRKPTNPETYRDHNDDNELPNPKNDTKTEYTKEELLRDLFLWSIFMDMPEMGKILLVHLQSRICAALIASAIFKRYAKASTTVDHKEKFQDQALEFETYAALAIDKCYEYNERLGCELLLREIPLFGNVTCMQVAISSETKKLVGTYCFDQTLSQVWYNKLSIENHQTYAKIFQFLSLLSFGFAAPLLITFRDEETKNKDEQLSSAGINWYIHKKDPELSTTEKYWPRFIYFHDSPLIKMCYHFISYIFFLLVFSYMMLYHFDGPDTFRVPHWTEIYVTITVSTMLCEDIRKLYHEYKTRMLERWGSTGSTLLTVLTNIFYILPYILFYVGLALRYRAYNSGLLTAARIIWAFDLEFWYIKSLKFVVALKSVGPKLFMLKNMLRDLAAFIYMIFIAIAAYGVVSRALILYNQVPFTGKDIFSQIFYEPYWFIYGEVSDKDLLDEMISNGTDSAAAEATATHVLLAFHMLFINILILNLLIAVFTDTIDKVKENTEFYWRYQRYSFVRDYFERPPLAYPPLVIFSHIFLALLALRRMLCPKLCHNKVTDVDYTSKSRSLTRLFKMIPIRAKIDEQNERWNGFENAATHSYARSIVEKNKKKGTLTSDDIHSKSTMSAIESDVIKPISDQQEMITNLNKEMVSMRSVLNDNQKNITEINTQMKQHLQQLTKSLNWMMDAMVRVKMNSHGAQRPVLEVFAVELDVPESTQATTSSDV